MKPTDKVRDAYREYLQGERPFDEVVDLAERTWESIRSGLPPRGEPASGEVEAKRLLPP